jgi:hypothetical protein
MRPHITSDFGIFVAYSELFALRVFIVFQIDWIVGKAIGVGCSLNSQVLPRDIILLSALKPVVVVLHHLPPSVLPFKLLDPLPFQLLLLALLFFLSFHFVISSEVFLEPLQCVNVVSWGLFWAQEARSPSPFSHSHGELA